ncbi:hypothetical protein [Nitrincola tapanii]|uniref:Uncharacterized protein n=1 Tax=Nitrincola tapanii TaxID=1708751 RepID=A0A5A9W2S1_9GAMM|nr:hypothetical protein [Nitrincola tapanii]KAA0874395.1 hypothetical protein E1H14_08980 [Nitrincola tapanii]
MKINAMMKKSALAVAITAGSVSYATAATHVFAPGSFVNTLAHEVFGTGSNATAVAVPTTVFTATTNNTYALGNILTVKYTLDAGAVFSEDYSDIQKWFQAGTTLSFVIGGLTYVIDNNGDTIEDPAGLNNNLGQAITVDQGGAVNDNTVTFKIDTTQFDGAGNFASATVGQFRVFNLKDALEPGSSIGQVRLGGEFRNVTQDVTDTVQALVVLQSQKGVDLTSTQTSSAVRPAIDSADNLLSFTSDVGDLAFVDFDASGNVDTVKLGTLAVVRTEDENGRRVRKENGDEFDFQGSDEINVSLTTSTDISAFGSLYLSKDNCVNNALPLGATTVNGTTVNFNLQGQTTSALQAGYDLCFTADGVNQMPNFSVGAATLLVNYFNPRYLDSTGNAGPFGQLVRNGCEVTLFNVPNPSAQDQAFIRLSNISELPGPVSAFIYDEAGNQSAEVDLGISIPAHGTAILHTNANLADNANRVYLPGQLPELAALTEGRARIVLNGAFPSCEALGLVRSPNGTLVNVTSTTYSGAVTTNDLINRSANGTSNSSN